MENPSQPTDLMLLDAKLGLRLSDVLLFLFGYLSRLDTKATGCHCVLQSAVS